MSDKIINEFADLLYAHGAPVLVEYIIPDDNRHRVPSTLDKGHDKTVTYQLKIDGDVGIGWFHSFKFGMSAGITVKFFSSTPRKLTAEQKADWAIKMAESKKLEAIKQAAREAKRERMSKRLLRCLRGMALAESHNYLTDKRVGANGIKIREKTGELIIPVYQKDGYPWSVQKITRTGSKWFLAGGKIEGGYYPMAGAVDDKSTIIIAEGFATAATIRETLNIPVIVAFNAGNLLKVAIEIRAKHPEANIVIAADNDRFRKDGNIGITKATEAAGNIRGYVVYPDFPEGRESGTDWNDYINAHGDEQLREKMQRVTAARASGESEDVVSLAVTTRSPITLQGDWRDSLICDEKGKMIKSSLTNAMLFIQHHDDFVDVFKLNEFQREIYVATCPKWENESEFRPHRISDNDITNCSAWIEKYGISCDPARVIKAIAAVSENNGFHPAREYFDGLEWDGKERLKDWLTYYMGAEDDDEEYLAFIGKKWLTAAVKRVYEAGCKFDHVLVMEGAQGRGKSTALEYMATFGDIEEAYFTDNIKIADIQNKDTILLLQGSIIVELAELAGFNKKDDEEVKGWVTLKVDRCRKPYERTVTIFPRQFVLAATTNSYDYLKDPTGNRRYWCFKSSAVDLQAIKRDRKQLWAEAVMHYKAGLYIGPTEDEMRLAEIAQEKRRSIDSWEDEVLKAARDAGIMGLGGFSTNDIFEKLNILFRDRDHKSTRRIAGILQQAGYDSTTKKVAGKTVRIWVQS